MNGRPQTRVLFVCVGNMIRSQMAEAFAREAGDGRVEAHSAGFFPAGAVSDKVITVMREKGIDLRGQWSKGLDDVPVASMDFVVSLCGEPAASACPPSFSGTALDWPTTDPLGGGIEDFRRIRDQIERRVRRFVDDITGD